MAFFRKRPVVIEAWQFDPHCLSTMPMWLATSRNLIFEVAIGEIHTREGVMRFDTGDWIIKGVKGELYPCKPEIFELTYEPNI